MLTAPLWIKLCFHEFTFLPRPRASDFCWNKEKMQSTWGFLIWQVRKVKFLRKCFLGVEPSPSLPSTKCCSSPPKGGCTWGFWFQSYFPRKTSQGNCISQQFPGLFLSMMVREQEKSPGEGEIGNKEGFCGSMPAVRHLKPYKKVRSDRASVSWEQVQV